MSIHRDQIDKLYRLAKKFDKNSTRNFSQVGEKYDPKKFGGQTKANHDGS